MDPTALYYAFSTLAQCASALAALIGFFGLWRLGWLRDKEIQAEETMEQLVIQEGHYGPEEIARQGKTFFLERARFIINPPPGTTWSEEPAIKPQLHEWATQWHARRREQQELMRRLNIFLLGTLVILVLAIVGIPFAHTLQTWPWTSTILIVLASVCLGIGPFYVVSEAARSLRACVVLTLLLPALTTPALAGPVRCTTYEEKTLGRLQTLCADGTRAVSTWSPTLGRWDTTVTPPPGQTCQGRFNPKTRQWEGRCR